MKSKTGVTKTEVAIVLVCVVFMLLIIPGNLIYERSHELGLRSVCLGNLKQISISWMMYADDNDGKIVNGAAGISRPNEPAWTGKDWADDYREGGVLKPNEREEAIRSGVLWPYCMNEKAYQCPRGQKGHKRTYSIIDSMNGVPQPGDPKGRGPKDVLDTLIAKNRGKIQSPHTRVVFICVGWATPGSYAVYYDKEKWWDLPPVRHEDGVTFSLADAHAKYWKWKGKETIQLGESAGPTQLSQHIEPKTDEGKGDLQKMQRAVWGKLGYTPSVSEQ